MFTSIFPISSEGGSTSFQNNVPDPVTSGKELPTFKFELEKSEGRVMGGQLRQGSDRRPVADLQGHRRRLDAHGAGRDARIALACDRRGVGLRHRGPGAHHRHRSAGLLGDQRLRARRHLVFSARPWPRARDARRQALPFHPGVRQRVLLRVRHLQHFRLDRACAEGAARQELRRAGRDLRQLPEGGGLFRQGQDSARGSVAAAAGMEEAAAHPQIQHAVAAAVRDVQRRPRMARRRLAVPDLHHHDGRRAGDGRRARCASCTGIPTPPSGNTS